MSENQVTESQRATLAEFFAPRSAVLVGASDKSYWSFSISSRFAEFGADMKLYAVNRSGADAHGIKGYTSCTELPEPADIAYIYVPAAAVLGAVEDCGKGGVKGAVILTSGFAETDDAGAALQDEIVAMARRYGMRLVGPNSLGFANVAGKAVCTAIKPRLPLRVGRVGFVSQSGAILSELVKQSHQQGVGYSFAAATGNEAMISLADIIDYLVEDPATRVIAVFAETIRDADRLRAAALRARAARKAIVIFKVGRSQLSAAIAQAHTGSLVGNDAIFDAACEQYGIIRADSVEDLISTAGLIDELGPIDQGGVGMISVSGGGCGMFADAAELYGVPLNNFTPETVAKLAAVMPDFGTVMNPLDITGAVMRDNELWTRVIPIVAQDPNIGVLGVIHSPPGNEAEIPSQIGHFTAIHNGFEQSCGVPGTVVALTYQPYADAMVSLMEKTGHVPIALGLDQTVRSFAHILRWSRSLKEPTTLPELPATAAVKPVGERPVLDYLASQGVPVIPTVIAQSRDEAVAHAAKVGGKVVLKIASADIGHKTEVGGVILNIEGDAAVGAAYDQILASVAEKAPMARIDGVLVAPMRSGGLELFVGTAHDENWGLALAVGIGGVWVEALKDTTTRLLPVTRDQAKEMLGRLRSASLLQGFRGAAPADLDAVADAIVAIGNAALRLGPDLVALEINPLLVDGSRVEALDGLTVWAEGAAGGH